MAGAEIVVRYMEALGLRAHSNKESNALKDVMEVDFESVSELYC